MRKGIAWVIVIGGHVLLMMVLTFDSARPRIRGVSEPESSEPTILMFLDLPPPEEEEPAQQPQPERTPLTRPRERTVASASSDTAITLPPGEADSPATRSSVDWYRQAEEVAKDHADELMAYNKTPCAPDQSDRSGSLLEKCRKRVKPHEWQPEEGRFGMSGLLPFVRLGKRCAVGLGFFGCALGKLPEADGHLFDDLQDPDRQTSSVPDIPGKEY